MPTRLNWIETPWGGQLAVSPRPRAGDWLEDDLIAWRQAGATAILSLLEPHENADLGLEDEPAAAKRAALAFISFSVVDRGVPASLEDARVLLIQVETLLKESANIVIHCRQGIGRSGLIAVAILLLAGVSIDRAIELVSTARGLPIPETVDQLEWLRSFSARR